MPVQPSYPGVYIEEIPSGIRTITGVATSIAAFIGRASRGPTDKPVTINSFADYERVYGGLDLNSAMSYAIRDFYLNGGTQAIICRLYRPKAGGVGKSVLSFNGLDLEAAYEGTWGNSLRARVDHVVDNSVATTMGLQPGELFNLYVRDIKTGTTEEHRNVSVIPSSRKLDEVLKNYSNLIRVKGSLPGNIPSPSNDPQPGEDPWEDNQTQTNYSVTTLADKSEMLDLSDYNGPGNEQNKQGLYMLLQTDLFNLLCIPPDWDTNNDPDDYPPGLLTSAVNLCEKQRAMLILDSPKNWIDKESARNGIKAGVGVSHKNAALYFPRIKQPDPLRDNQIIERVPCGCAAGVIARTDGERGVWKAPAGFDATLRGVPELTVDLNDQENGELNPLGLNCLRTFPVIGRVVWGSRTLKGADMLASEWKYIPVRRMALFIEESLYRGLHWVVFEPNDEPLWAQIRLSAGAFMNRLFRQGAFQGSTRELAYLVKCDSETTTQNDINLGVVNIVIGFAPLKPAEFVFIKIQQLTGQQTT